MSSKRLRRLDISPDVVERLSKRNVTNCKDVLTRDLLELVRLTGLGGSGVNELLDKVSAACLPAPVNGLALWQSRKGGLGFFPTSLGLLDRALLGGLPLGTITEVVGPAGSGKTQFCMMLSVLAAMPTETGGLGTGVIFIDTEGAFSATRLLEMARTRIGSQAADSSQLEATAGRVYVDRIQTCQDLMLRLQTLEGDVIERGVGLLLLDSMASLVRKEYSSQGAHSLAHRSSFLTRVAATLKQLAQVFNLPVVVTNQITTRFDHSNSFNASFTGQGGGTLTEAERQESHVTAALGNTWSHSVNTRLVLQYLHGSLRQVMVAKSPAAPFTSFTFSISAQGLALVDGGAGHYKGTDPTLQTIRVRSSLPIGSSQTY